MCLAAVGLLLIMFSYYYYLLLVFSCGHVLLCSCHCRLISVVAEILVVVVTEPFIQHLDLMVLCITNTVSLVVVSPFCTNIYFFLVVIVILIFLLVSFFVGVCVCVWVRELPRRSDGRLFT